jgi:hypothetical protein
MLSKDATFEDLADQLGRLGARHHGKPVAIEVKLAALSALRAEGHIAAHPHALFL